MFEIRKRDGLARLGVFHTEHGVLNTPTLLPVVNPLKLIIKPEDFLKMGADGLITNAYIILRSARHRKAFEKHGLHTVLNFDGPIMTDSGTFQAHVYGRVDVKPADILKFQAKIGSDISTILDLFTEPDTERKEVISMVDETVKRAGEAAKGRKGRAIAAPVQGSIFPDQRARCARAYRDMDLQVHPIGGVVPLMEDYRYVELVDVVMSSVLNLPPERPTHLFGAGHPMVFGLAVLMGMDLFDSSAYAKYAIDDRIMFPWGTRHLKDMDTFPCSCEMCSRYTPKELREQKSEIRQEALARHNLWTSFQEIKTIHQAISEGSLWEFVAMRTTCHPELYAAYRHLLKWSDKIERFEPLSRTSEFIMNANDVQRPAFVRYRKRLRERVVLKGDWSTVQLKEGTPFDKRQEREKVIFHHPVGFIPDVLDQVYPAGLVHTSGELPLWRKTLERSVTIEKGADTDDPDERRVRAVSAYQFEPEIADIILDGDLSIVTSNKTGRVRTVHAEGKHVLSMRNDGFFSLKVEGARRIQAATDGPTMRVTVVDDSAENNRLGRNVFAQFVVGADPALGVMDETIVVNDRDEVMAVGRVVLTGEELPRFKKGIVVKVRDGIGAPDGKEKRSAD